MGAVGIGREAELFVAARDRLRDGTRLLVEVQGKEIAVFEHQGTVYAYENRCVHQGGPVCEGVLVGQVQRILDAEQRDCGGAISDTEIHLVCPWHGWEFDLSTGRSIAYPSLALRRFEVVERDDQIFLVV